MKRQTSFTVTRNIFMNHSDEIFNDYKNFIPLVELAKKYNCSYNTISNILAMVKIVNNVPMKDNRIKAIALKNLKKLDR